MVNKLLLAGGIAVASLYFLSKSAKAETNQSYIISNNGINTIAKKNNLIIDSNTDSSTLINNVISLLIPNDSILFDGSFTLSNTIQFTNKTNINIAHKNGFFTNNYGDYNNIIFDYCSHITLDGIHIKNSGYSPNYRWTYCFLFSDNIISKNCYIENSQESDYRTHECTNITFDNCISKKDWLPNTGVIIGDAFDIFNSTDVKVDSCTWKNNALQFYASNNCSATNNTGPLYGVVDWKLDNQELIKGCSNISFNNDVCTGSGTSGFIAHQITDRWQLPNTRHTNINFNNCISNNNLEYGFNISATDIVNITNCTGTNNILGNKIITDCTNINCIGGNVC